MLVVRGLVRHSFTVSWCIACVLVWRQCDKLRLALVSPPGDRAITALAATGELTITACGPRVFVWKRLELVQTSL